jgi:hypothetical protein
MSIEISHQIFRYVPIFLRQNDSQLAQQVLRQGIFRPNELEEVIFTRVTRQVVTATLKFIYVARDPRQFSKRFLGRYVAARAHPHMEWRAAPQALRLLVHL